jgi:hypothetical protein
MLSVLVVSANCWGPVFHQHVADEFAAEYLPHLSPSQRNAFVLGSIFIDGLPKRVSHELSWCTDLLRSYENETDEWWFVMGFALHLVVDVAGHLGKPNAFLPLQIPIHYLAELSACSSIRKEYDPIRVGRSALSDAVFQKVIHRSSLKFSMISRAWWAFAYLPFYRLLGSMESDKCMTPTAKPWAFCNLQMHLRTIKGLMWDSLCALMTGDFTGSDLGRIVSIELKALPCCSCG